jgi:hypothetical protein
VRVACEFTREQLGPIKFLHPATRQDSRQILLSTESSVKLGEALYKVLIDRSGLPDGHFGTLIYEEWTCSTRVLIAGEHLTSNSPFPHPTE